MTNTLTFIVIAALFIIAAGALTLAYSINESAKQERQELTRALIAKDQDILDRLMAKDLQDVKYKQREPDIGPGVTSKRQNDKRVAEQHAKMAQSQ